MLFSGEIWVGPSGLLGLLETMTGLSGPPIPNALRAAELVSTIRAASGFWSRSAQVDPFGTAKRVLDWRDQLRMYGWRFQPVSTRLGDLAEVTEKASPGFPDRLLMVAETLMASNNAVQQLTLLEPPDRFPSVLQTTIQSLKKTGTKIIEEKLKPVKSAGDLAACTKSSFKTQRRRLDSAAETRHLRHGGQRNRCMAFHGKPSGQNRYHRSRQYSGSSALSFWPAHNGRRDSGF